jgi:3-oxoadipate enol-lactonase
MTTEQSCVRATRHPGRDDPPVVLLHSLAMDHSIWDAHVAAVDGRFPVITCDLPGHGSACGIDGEYPVERMADEVARCLRDEGVSGAVVAGLSLGGCVAQSLAGRHPDLVGGLLLADTTAWYGEDAPANWEARAQKARNEGFDSLADFQIARWFSPGYVPANPDVAERLLAIFRSNDITSYVATCRAMGRYDGRAMLERITVPSTVLVGELDPATPVAHAEDLAARLAGARLRIVDGASHMSPVERPEPFLEELFALHGRVVEARWN